VPLKDLQESFEALTIDLQRLAMQRLAMQRLVMQRLVMQRH
jgi:hypothetical protein